MVQRVIIAVLVAVIVALVLPLLGSILIDLKADIAVTIGQFLKGNATVIGLIAGLWYFFTGQSWFFKGAK
jgi:hypothetical protein